MSEGIFITFEGGEGVGKSTQILALCDHLKSLGFDVVVTREPGGTPYAEDIRASLLSGAAKEAGPDAEAILVSAARADHLENLIRPALQSGKWVLCDRFTDSTLVYQGILSGGDVQFICRLNAETVGETVPDLTLVLDAPVDIATARVGARKTAVDGDRFDQQPDANHAIIRDAFLAIAEADAERCAVIDASGAADEVSRNIRDAMEMRLRRQWPDGVDLDVAPELDRDQ